MKPADGIPHQRVLEQREEGADGRVYQRGGGPMEGDRDRKTRFTPPPPSIRVGRRSLVGCCPGAVGYGGSMKMKERCTTVQVGGKRMGARW